MSKPPVVIDDILKWRSNDYELYSSVLKHNYTLNIDLREYVIRDKETGLFFRGDGLVDQKEISFSAFRRAYPRMKTVVDFGYLEQPDDAEALALIDKQMKNCRDIFYPRGN